VYAGTDVLTGRRLHLKKTIAAGPDARVPAEEAMADLARQVQEGWQPRTNASLAQSLERHPTVAEMSPQARLTSPAAQATTAAPF
jgi:integrase